MGLFASERILVGTEVVWELDSRSMSEVELMGLLMGVGSYVKVRVEECSLIFRHVYTGGYGLSEKEITVDLLSYKYTPDWLVTHIGYYIKEILESESTSLKFERGCSSDSEDASLLLKKFEEAKLGICVVRYLWSLGGKRYATIGSHKGNLTLLRVSLKNCKYYEYKEESSHCSLFFWYPVSNGAILLLRFIVAT